MTHTDGGVFRAYSILGLPVNASQNDVKEKFKALVLQVRSLFLYTTFQFSSRLTKVSTEKLAKLNYSFMQCFVTVRTILHVIIQSQCNYNI